MHETQVREQLRDFVGASPAIVGDLEQALSRGTTLRRRRHALVALVPATLAVVIVGLVQSVAPERTGLQILGGEAITSRGTAQMLMVTDHPDDPSGLYAEVMATADFDTGDGYVHWAQWPQGREAGQRVVTEYLTLEETTFVRRSTGSTGGQWQATPRQRGSEPFVIVNLDGVSIIDSLAYRDTFEVLPDEQVRGSRARVFRADVPYEEWYFWKAGSAGNTTAVTVTVFIDDANRAVKMISTEPANQGARGIERTTVEFWDFGIELDLEAPNDVAPETQIIGGLDTVTDIRAITSTDVEAGMREGPVLDPDHSALGMPGVAVIYGHRTTYGAPFYSLDLLEPGMTVLIRVDEGRPFVHEVIETHVIGAEDDPTDLVDDDGSSAWTLLVTQHPRFSDEQRLVVVTRRTPAS